MLTLLQLSDIHFKKFDNALDEYTEMRQRMKDCVSDYCQTGHIDYLMICGDVAFSGNAYEYENKAKPFIAELMELMGAEVKDVFVIPGNHDKNREAAGKHTRAFLRDGLLYDAEADFVLDSIKREEPETLKNLYAPFHDYMEFANEYSCLSPVAEKMLSGSAIGFSDKMFWNYKLATIGDYTIVLNGINSCLASDGKDEKGHIQALPAMLYKTVQERKVVNICMMHHPIELIEKGAAIESQLDDLYAVQFYGHIHKQSYRKDDAIKVYSGALQPDIYEEEDKTQYQPVFNIVEIDVQGDTLYLTVKPYIWDWNTEDVSFKAGKQETFTLDLTRQRDARTIHNHQNRILPEGVTIRDVKIRLMSYPHYHNIIKEMYDDFEVTGDKGKDCIRFFEQVEREGRIVELNNKLNQYGR